MAFYGLLLISGLMLWAALGFAGLSARVTVFARVGFAIIVLLAAGSFVIAEAMGT